MEAYPLLLQRKLLHPMDTYEIARLLHVEHRTKKSKVSPEALSNHVRDFIDNYKKRRLPPHKRAAISLIGYYKEAGNFDDGLDFWNWLIQQDDNYVSIQAYGAGIELLAAYGRDLEYCEEVYNHALKRFNVDFNDYHLSSGAIVPDRAEHMLSRGISMSLLQGMICAQLLHGDWQGAYLSLDTAFRLHPTQIPPRVYQIFLYERPLNEVYQVFCMACQSGSTVSAKSLTVVLDHLIDAQEIGGDVDLNLDLVRAMLRALQAYIASGNKAEAPHLNCLFRGIMALLPDLIGSPIDNTLYANDVSQSVTKLFEQLQDLFCVLGVLPNLLTFSEMISLGGRLGQVEIVTLALKRMKAAGLTADQHTYSRLVVSGGNLKDASMVQSAWARWNECGPEEGKKSMDKWITLCIACSKAGIESYALEQLQMSKHAPKESSLKRLLDISTPNVIGASKFISSTKSTTHFQYIRDIGEELDTIRDQIAERRFRNLKNISFGHPSIWPWSTRGNEAWQRKLYDELTSDSSAPALAPPNAAEQSTGGHRVSPESSTGYPLDELRYLNWRSINDLLMQAEVFENRVEQAVNKAITQGKPASSPRNVRYLKNSSKQKEHEYVSAQLKAYRKDVGVETARRETEEEWRNRVLTLRRQHLARK